MQTSRSRLVLTSALVAVLAFAATPVAVGAQEAANQLAADVLPLKLAMNAQALGAAVQGQSRLEITIERFSTDEQRETLLGALRELGPGAVRSELQKMPQVGRARLGAELSYPLQYARLFRNPDGGWIVVLATDRDIEPWEAYYQTRTLDYDLVLSELRLDEDLTGEGVLASGVMLGWNADTNTVIIEDYDTQPVRLKNIRRIE